ncbi:hypothetical protein MKW94_009459 [Papaver nudicaule]|uniref:ZF-HD dimerization-type domain-containing protein n=1 Tax=Papaver nudicaule TaxID=74823 RepID=A0AA41UTE9_PAPNU|nr:hypothetical protein [Papaver nudicaule]
MNLSSEEDDQIPISNPIPITSKYTMVVHGNHHHHHPQNHFISSLPGCGYSKKPVVVKYRECMRNHAAHMGGSVIDGCCEFMPDGKEGSLEALKCSACNCHRNFHRKCIIEEEEEESPGHESTHQQHTSHLVNKMRKTSLLTPHQVLGSLDQSLYPTTTVSLIKPCNSKQQLTQLPSQSSKIMMLSHSQFHSHSRGSSLPAASSDSDEIKTVAPPPAAPPAQPASAPPPQVLAVKKRFRSKFTQEQKDKMLSFAEKVGWSFQKEEEAVVLQICQEIGIKKRVLRVWMHNNKHNFANKKKLSFHCY